MRIACLQMRSTGNIEENLTSLRRMVASAATGGAHYIQSPEMTSFVTRDRQQLFANIEPAGKINAPNKVISFTANLAREYKIWLHIGSIAVKSESDQALNRGLLFSPKGNLVATYDKIHMFDVDLPRGESWRESSTYEAGSHAIVVKSETFTLGMAICYDLRFPALYRFQALAGAQILTCPAAFTHQTGLAHWHILLRARAIENGAFMIAAAQGGRHQDGRQTFGHSLVVNPWGEIIAELNHDEAGVLFCDIDLDEVRVARQRIPSLKRTSKYQIKTITTRELERD